MRMNYESQPSEAIKLAPEQMRESLVYGISGKVSIHLIRLLGASNMANKPAKNDSTKGKGKPMPMKGKGKAMPFGKKGGGGKKGC